MQCNDRPSNHVIRWKVFLGFANCNIPLIAVMRELTASLLVFKWWAARTASDAVIPM